MDKITTVPCPYGGNTSLVIRIDNTGAVWAKCILASAVRAQDPSDVKSEWADNQRKAAGCPRPVYHRDSYKNCPYVLGKWKKE